MAPVHQKCVCMPNVSDTVKKADMTVTGKITECAFAVKMSEERETERELECDRHREGAKRNTSSEEKHKERRVNELVLVLKSF